MIMKVEQVGGQSYDSNIYFIDSSEPILIDAGTGVNEKQIVATLRDRLADRQLARIILTHCHFDHTGGAAGLVSAFGAPVVIHPLDAEPVRAGDSMRTGAFLFGSKMAKVDVDTIEEGELTIGELTFDVIHTPGHSPGSISLYHKPSRTLFSGDAVFTNGGVGRWDLPGGSRKTLVKSLERLNALKVENLYTGHGPSAEGDGNAHIKWGLQSISGAGFW